MLSDNPTPKEILDFYDLHTAEGTANFSNADEGLSITLWHSLSQALDEVAQLEMRIAIQEKTILAHENDTACLPEDYSVTEYVQHLEAEVERLQKEINDLADIIRIKDAIDAEKFLEVQDAE